MAEFQLRDKVRQPDFDNQTKYLPKAILKQILFAYTPDIVHAQLRGQNGG
jgi:hypothetical protein